MHHRAKAIEQALVQKLFPIHVDHESFKFLSAIAAIVVLAHMPKLRCEQSALRCRLIGLPTNRE